MLEVVSIIASRYGNIYRAIIWILKQGYIGRTQPQWWELNIHLYNVVNFVECIEYRRYAVHIYRESAVSNHHFIKFQPSQSESKIYDSNKCFKNQSINWENHTEGISLHKEYLMQMDN